MKKLFKVVDTHSRFKILEFFESKELAKGFRDTQNIEFLEKKLSSEEASEKYLTNKGKGNIRYIVMRSSDHWRGESRPDSKES